MKSILTESLCSLYEVTTSMPSNRAGKRTNFSTAWRWATKGILAPNGERIRLEVAKVGGRLLTSREAIERFSAALTPVIEGGSVAMRTPAERGRAASAASKRLEAIGI